MRLALAAAALALSACGGDVDLTGTYQVYDNEGGPCGSQLGDLSTRYYIVMAPVDVGYQAQCFQDAALQVISYAEPGSRVFDHTVDGGWSGTSASTGHDSEGGACWVNYIVAVATRDGDRLHIDVRRYAQNATMTNIPCTVDEAERRGTTLNVCGDTRIDATKL